MGISTLPKNLIFIATVNVIYLGMKITWLPDCLNWKNNASLNIFEELLVDYINV